MKEHGWNNSSETHNDAFNTDSQKHRFAPLLFAG